MDCSLPGSYIHGILQARILEWVAIFFSRGSSWLRDWTRVFCIAGRFFILSEPPRKPLGPWSHGERARVGGRWEGAQPWTWRGLTYKYLVRVSSCGPHNSAWCIWKLSHKGGDSPAKALRQRRLISKLKNCCLQLRNEKSPIHPILTG